MRINSPRTLLVVMALLAGCARQSPPAKTEAAPPASAPAPAANVPAVPPAWLGRWTGPEGGWLDITEAAGSYTVTVKNLDAARSFPGIVDAGGLSFERDGVRETIQASDGAGTGMKWLAEKTNCLKIKAGEGYCRD